MEQYTSNLTAIIADDEPSILKGIHGTVDWNALGITVIALAHDGAQALNLIMEHKPDIAIIDIKMPQMNGLEVIRKAREAHYDTDFIILSGYNHFEYARDAVRHGARAYLLKPANGSELYGELYRIVTERNSWRKYGCPVQQSVPVAQNPNTAFFNNLIDSRIMDTDDIQSALTASQIELEDGPCYIMVLLFETPPVSFNELLSALDSHHMNAKHTFWQYGTDRIIGIFNVCEQSALQMAEVCLNVLCSAAAPLPMIGLGDVVSNLFQCSYSYSRALAALSYRIYDDTRYIYPPEIICTTFPSLKFEDIDFLPLIQEIEQGDIAGICRYCDNFIDQLLYVKMPPPNYLLNLCSALVGSVSQAFIPFYDVDYAKIIQIKELYAQKSLANIRTWLCNTFCDLSNTIASQHAHTSSRPSPASEETATEDPVIKEAEIYIEENITANIKLEDIARQVYLSPAYFASYFKNKTGSNLRDYLLLRKMEYAKKELLQPHASVNDIAAVLGYSDYRSFSRAFKNLFGITPSDFQIKSDKDI